MAKRLSVSQLNHQANKWNRQRKKRIAGLIGLPSIVETYDHIAWFGDSMTFNALGAARYARTALYRADIEMDDREFINGGRFHAVGGTPSIEMLEDQAPQSAVRPSHLNVFCVGGRNDAMASEANCDVIYNNVTNAADIVLNNGGKLAVIIPTMPDNVANIPRALANYLHNRYVEWAAEDPAHRRFLNVFDEWCDPTDLVNAKWVGDTDAFEGLTYDGPHGSLHFNRIFAPHFADLFESLAIPERQFISGLRGAFDPVNPGDKYVNSDNALFAGTDGRRNFVDDPNVAGVSQWTTENRWSLIEGANNAAAVPLKFDPNTQRLTFSGVPTADTQTILRWDGYQWPNTSNNDPTRLYELEAVMNCVNLNGCYGIDVTGNDLNPISLTSPAEPYSDSHRYPVNYTQELKFYSGVPLNIDIDTPSIVFTWWWKAGVPISGYVDLSIGAIKQHGT